MEHIEAIQEIIDVNKETMPTEIVNVLQKESHALYNGLKKLYKLTWTIVDSHVHVVQNEDDAPSAEAWLFSHDTDTDREGSRPRQPICDGGPV
eukprot:4870084-Prymnesium_polylepis.1